MNKIREIKVKVEQSETMVQEICRDIKKLYFSKKHITTIVGALHHLAMLFFSGLNNSNKRQLNVNIKGEFLDPLKIE